MIDRGQQFDDDDEFEAPEASGRQVQRLDVRHIGQHYAKDWLAQTPCDCGTPGGKRCGSCKFTGGMMSAGKLAKLTGQSAAKIGDIFSGRRSLGQSVAQRIADVVSPGSDWTVLKSPPPVKSAGAGDASDKFSARMRTQPKPPGL